MVREMRMERKDVVWIGTITVIGSVWVYAAAGWAAQEKTKGKQDALTDQAVNGPAAPAPASDVTTAPAVSSSSATMPQPPKPQSPEEGIRAQLDGTRWPLGLTSLSSDEKVKAQKDTVKFAGSKMSSERMAKAGYPDSNYTLTIGGDGVAVWETMQTKEGEGVAFWRGEFHGATMRGVLSKHPIEGATEDFSFTSQEAGGKTIEVSAPGSPGVKSVHPASSVPPAETPTSRESSKKKHKRLFGR